MEDNDVLVGQRVDCLDILQFAGFSFLPDLFQAHLVKALYRDEWIFFTVFDKNQPTTWFEGSSQRGRHLCWMRELVIDVHHESQIERKLRYSGITGRTLNRSVVLEISTLHVAR